jgi:hypothetical protein
MRRDELDPSRSGRRSYSFPSTLERSRTVLLSRQMRSGSVLTRLAQPGQMHSKCRPLWRRTLNSELETRQQARASKEMLNKREHQSQGKASAAQNNNVRAQIIIIQRTRTFHSISTRSASREVLLRHAARVFEFLQRVM